MGFKLAISNIAWAPEDDEAVYALMHRYRFTGLEIAPTRIFPDDPYEDLDRAKAWSDALRAELGFDIPSMQSIWYGRKENFFVSQEDFDALTSYTRKALDFAKTCDILNLVFGCPRNRNVPEGKDSGMGFIFFSHIGRLASRRERCIGLEANPPMYNTNYINTTEEALDMIDDVQEPGFGLNLDLGTVIANSESLNILHHRVMQISHVHISEPGLKPIVPRPIHAELAGILRKENYNRYISIEMGRVESLAVLEEAMQYVRGIFGDDE